MDPITYRHLLNSLQLHLEGAIPLLVAQKEVVPPLPSWGLKDNPRELWSANDFEFVVALLQDDVKNLIGFLYDQKEIRKKKSPHKPFFKSEEGRTSTPVRRSQITHLSIHPTPVSTSREMHPSQIQNKVVFSPDTQPRRSMDTFTHA